MHEQVVVNGEKTTRLELAKEATKKLIRSLLDKEESNIYIGIIAFSGKATSVSPLSNDKNLLLSKLNEKITQWTYTDTQMALEACEYAFAGGDNSKKEIVVISDGVPTKVAVPGHKKFPATANTKNFIAPTVDMGNPGREAEFDSVMTQIKNETNKTIKEIREKGITVRALYNQPRDQEEQEFIKELFDNKDVVLMNEENMIEEIAVNLRKELEEKAETNITNTNTTFDPQIVTVLGGGINSERQAKIKEALTGRFYYNHEGTATDGVKEIGTTIFEANTPENRIKLSKLTYMVVKGGEGYKIEEPIDLNNIPSGGVETYGDKTITTTITRLSDGYVETKVSEWTDEEEDDDGNKKTQKNKHTVITTYRNAAYENQDMSLALIQNVFKLKLSAKPTILNVILANGTVLSQIKNLTFSSSSGAGIQPIIQSLDQEISHGATVQAQYAIVIQNTSNFECNYLELIAYVPKGFRYITNSKTNDKGWDAYWQAVDLEKLVSEGYITKEAAEKHKNEDAFKIVLDNKGKGDYGFFISAGARIQVNLALTQVISNLENFGGDKQIEVEVLGYSNNGSPTRRTANIEYRDETKIIQAFKPCYPGNSIAESKETPDYAISQIISVLPPFGRKSSATQLVIVTTSCTLIIAVTTITIIKRRKNLKIK